MDDGVQHVFDALKVNTTLRNLYLGTNGLTVKSAKIIGHHLGSGKNKLTSLYASVNQFGDEGAIAIAKGLSKDENLQRLSLASDGISEKGVKELCDAIVYHPSLQEVNLGYAKTTIIIGSLSNMIGDVGAEYIAQMLESNTVIRSIDVSHNGISSKGMEAFARALICNQVLTSLHCNQFGQTNKNSNKKEIQEILTRNKMSWGKQVMKGEGDEKDWTKKGEELAYVVESPEHVTEILSVYRTK